MLSIKLFYIANIIVAGYVGGYSLFSPKTAMTTVFSNAYAETEVVRMAGCLWLGITLLSFLGLWKPITFSPVLLLQLFYKGTWLVVVALPTILNKSPYPNAMAFFFLIWCLLLPFVIPWSKWIEMSN